MLRFLISLLVFILFNGFGFAQDAVYSLDFNSNWTSSTHPTNYPSAAHWSSLVGTTHNNSISFWSHGQLASEGVEEVAENGDTTIIIQDINTAIGNGNAYEVILLPLGFGENFSFEGLNVDSDFPYVSLMTMVAPSPDWLAEISNVKLTDASGNWKTSISIDVYATDSGTDSGTTYVSPNEDTDPAENIYSMENTLPFSDQIVATFVITLDQVLGVDDRNFLQNAISIGPNPSQGKVFIHNSADVVLESAEIYAITGKKVKVFNNISKKKSLAFNSLQSGLYFLKINSDKGSVTKKLIIQ